MIEVVRVVALCALAALACAACSKERCDDLSARALAGTYKELVPGNQLNVTDVRLRAGGEQVVLTYRRPDGANVRVTYKVIEKIVDDR
jgi:hypothetical protein